MCARTCQRASESCVCVCLIRILLGIVWLARDVREREREKREERAPNLSNMDHLTSVGSSDDDSKICKQFMHCNSPSSPQNMYLLQSSGSDFSLGVLQPQDCGQPFAVQNQLLPHSQTETCSFNLEPHIAQAGDLSSCSYNHYHQGCPFQANQGLGPHYVGHESFGALLKSGMPHTPAVVPAAASPEALLDTLSLIEHKVQQLQGIVRLMVHRKGQQAMQQALTAEVTSVLSQLIAATAGLLQQSSESAAHHASSSNLQLNHMVGETSDSRPRDYRHDTVNHSMDAGLGDPMENRHKNSGTSSKEYLTMVGGVGTGSARGSDVGHLEVAGSGLRDQRTGCERLVSPSVALRNTGNPPRNMSKTRVGAKASPNSAVEASISHGMDCLPHQVIPSEGTEMDLPLRDDDDDDNDEGENLPPGSYELVEMDATEILAEHTHFCEICGKGFKRDANLRMHMRGHGDEYKTPAALARPAKSTHSSVVRPRRYSCPYLGCKRNKQHCKFLPLKTMLCVKNHYRRSHCPKIFTCSKCNTKKFSVAADLKTHEKHCGCNKWRCSCGTTFSRKDKLFGHIALFAGHTAVLPSNEEESSVGGLDSETDCLISEYDKGMEGLPCSDSMFWVQEDATVLLKKMGQHECHS